MPNPNEILTTDRLCDGCARPGVPVRFYGDVGYDLCGECVELVPGVEA